MGILKICLYALLPLFVLGNLGRFQLRNGIFITPLDVGIIVLLPFAVYFLTLHQDKLKQNPLAKYLLIFVSALLLSLLVNIFTLHAKEMLTASLYFLRLFAYIQLVFIFALFSKSFAKRYLWLLGITVTITAFLGFIQYFLYNNLRNLEYLGWDVHQYRVFSVFLDPNFAGVIFLLGACVTYFFAQTEKGKKRSVSLAQSALNLLALVFTYSRTAYITLLITTLATLKTAARPKVMIIALIAVVALIILLPKDLKSEGVKLFRTSSIYARQEEYIQGLTVFMQHPITGVGFNAYGKYNIHEKSPYPENATSGIPNSYILTMATAGVIGSAAFIYLVIGIIKVIQKETEKNRKTLLMSATLVVFVSAMFENTFYYNFIMLIYFVILGVTLRLKEST